MLTRSQTFYIAGIPHLYHAPIIKSKLASFFLHTPPGAPADIGALSTAELVSTGQTKLAALRYVRSIHLLLANYVASEDEDLQMTEEQKGQQEVDICAAVAGDLEAALLLVENLPRGTLPMLQTVRTGDTIVTTSFPHPTLNDRTTQRSLSAWHFAWSLLMTAVPKVWCQGGGAGPRLSPFQPVTLRVQAYSSGKRHPALEADADTSPLVRSVMPTCYMHTRIKDHFYVVPGGDTFVYLHPDSRDFLRKRHYQGYGGVTEATGEWLGFGIRSSILAHKDFDDLQALAAGTRIIFAGIVPLAEEPEDKAADLRRTTEIVRIAKAFAVQPTSGSNLEVVEACRAVQVEIRALADMPLCPACGERP